MRRFPRPSHTEPVTDGCMSSMLLMIITVACPPLGIIGFICYGIYSEIKGSYEAKKYHQSEEYKYQEWLWNEVRKGTSLENIDKKK